MLLQALSTVFLVISTFFVLNYAFYLDDSLVWLSVGAYFLVLAVFLVYILESLEVKIGIIYFKEKVSRALNIVFLVLGTCIILAVNVLFGVGYESGYILPPLWLSASAFFLVSGSFLIHIWAPWKVKRGFYLVLALTAVMYIGSCTLTTYADTDNSMPFLVAYSAIFLLAIVTLVAENKAKHEGVTSTGVSDKSKLVITMCATLAVMFLAFSLLFSHLVGYYDPY